MAIMSGFQPEDAGPIPATRSQCKSTSGSSQPDGLTAFASSLRDNLLTGVRLPLPAMSKAVLKGRFFGII